MLPVSSDDLGSMGRQTQSRSQRLLKADASCQNNQPHLSFCLCLLSFLHLAASHVLLLLPLVSLRPLSLHPPCKPGKFLPPQRQRRSSLLKTPGILPVSPAQEQRRAAEPPFTPALTHTRTELCKWIFGITIRDQLEGVHERE